MKKTRLDARQLRHRRIRKKVFGSSERPRLSVYFSNKHIYAQLINDEEGRTLACASTMEKAFSEIKPNIDGAAKIGEALAIRALEKNIHKVVFDRGGFLYHGKVKALADSAREKGLEF
ncbi:50S ribosomal protein L18 [Methylacidiphilum caldifontis]|uniref:Large ribosomal subunit protein uL18 n=1 Tax=Methylacidiphilum caldifontis TaxID=2795386 RepID=A0A4Y8P6E0_9BACT|nr:50S ribosomal protein L18 [Methylacidiphilum caldifontis]QSR89305.1 50S ribosomal protein L18 [Methylacidiphilum caldifontis]TFE65715.1 50S ribosomal protein L18 [Methylacidiphilum caldifontis]